MLGDFQKLSVLANSMHQITMQAINVVKKQKNILLFAHIGWSLLRLSSIDIMLQIDSGRLGGC